MDRTINLAVFLPPDKARKIRLPERIKRLCEKELIKVTVIDKIEQVTEDVNAKFDVLIHKVLDFHNEDDFDNKSASDVIRKMKSLSKKRKEIVIIDDVESCLKVSDRKHCYDLMQQSSMKVCGISVYVPKSIEIKEKMPKQSIHNMLTDSNIKFPILTKPMHAHNKIMSLVFNWEGLDEILEPCIIQEFANHSGVMYKVFVIGDRYNIVQRPSIKDVELNQTQNSIAIDSRNVSKMGRGFHPEIHSKDPSLCNWSSDLEQPDILNRNVLDKLCRRMSQLSKLYLFGFDLLVIKETGNYAIVDINQFPGYKGIPDNVFADNIVNLVKSCHNDKEFLRL